MEFEWDPAKAAANEKKHGLSFEEGTRAFGDPFAVTVADSAHSEQEARFVTLGALPNGRLVVVVHADRAGRIRLISVRRATARERRRYEEGL